MARSRKVLGGVWAICLVFVLSMQPCMIVSAGGSLSQTDMCGGVAKLLSPGVANTTEIVSEQARELNVDFPAEEVEDEALLVMANVKKAVNIRSEASENSEIVGKLYKDCGGTVLERKDGWTKIQSGNLVGWAADNYLLFGEEAKQMANDVGKIVALVQAETVRIRKEPNTECEVYGLLPKGELVDVVSKSEDEQWVCIDYKGKDGYVSAEFLEVDFIIDCGETNDEIAAREKREKEAKRNVNYGAVTVDADTTMLLAALIHCEAGGEPYEGQVAVGAVVMNRVRSKAYPDTIHGVIYASGQFTPAMSGKVDRVLESGKIYESCIQAAEEALAGTSNVGDLTHFRRVNGREGLVIGNHVFY